MDTHSTTTSLQFHCKWRLVGLTISNSGWFVIILYVFTIILEWIEYDIVKRTCSRRNYFEIAVFVLLQDIYIYLYCIYYTHTHTHFSRFYEYRTYCWVIFSYNWFYIEYWAYTYPVIMGLDVLVYYMLISDEHHSGDITIPMRIHPFKPLSMVKNLVLIAQVLNSCGYPYL